MAIKFPKLTFKNVVFFLSLLLNALTNTGTVEPLYDADAPAAPTAPAKPAAE